MMICMQQNESRRSCLAIVHNKIACFWSSAEQLTKLLKIWVLQQLLYALRLLVAGGQVHAQLERWQKLED